MTIGDGTQFSGLLIHTAVVYRRGAKKDRFGQPIRAGASSEFARYKCRCTARRGGREYNDRMTDVKQTTHEIFLEPGCDIDENDVVTCIGADGVYEIVTKAIINLIRHAEDGVGLHHIEVDVASESGTA